MPNKPIIKKHLAGCADGTYIGFYGTHLATVFTDPHGAKPHHPDFPGRWVALVLYRMRNGRLVCERSTGAFGIMAAEHSDSRVCADAAELAAWLGTGELAARLYETACLEV